MTQALARTTNAGRLGRFGSWVRAYGAARITEGLGERGEPTTLSAVCQWVAGRTSPRPSRARILVELSGGAVTLEDIYAQRQGGRANGSARTGTG